MTITEKIKAATVRIMSGQLTKTISITSPEFWGKLTMAMNRSSNQSGWQILTSIFSAIVRVPVAICTAFFVVCASVLGIVLIYRISTWLYIRLLATPWN